MIVTDPVDPDMVCRDPQAIDRMSRDALVWRQGHGIFLSRGKIVNQRFNWKLHQRSKDLGIVWNLHISDLKKFAPQSDQPLGYRARVLAEILQEQCRQSIVEKLNGASQVPRKSMEKGKYW